MPIQLDGMPVTTCDGNVHLVAILKYRERQCGDHSPP